MVCLRTDLSTHFQMLWTQIKNVECKLMQFVRVIQINSLRGEKPHYKPIPKISSCKLLSCSRRSDSGVQRRREEGKKMWKRGREEETHVRLVFKKVIPPTIVSW